MGAARRPAGLDEDAEREWWQGLQQEFVRFKTRNPHTLTAGEVARYRTATKMLCLSPQKPKTVFA